MRDRRLIIGCGYLGMPLARLWVEKGHQVFATTRGGPGREEAVAGLGAEPVMFDVVQGGELPEVSVVVTAVGLDRAAGFSMAQVYVDGLRNVIRAFKIPPSRWLHVSSTSVYAQDDGEWVDEESAATGGDTSGKVVLEAERLLLAEVPSATVLRFGGIYGPGRLLKAKAIRSGEVLSGDPSRWLNLIHQADGVRILDRLAWTQSIEGKTFNVVDREPVARGYFYRELAGILGCPEPAWKSTSPGEAPGPHEGNNRRVSSGKLGDLLGDIWGYPTYRQGLPASGPF